MSGIKGRNTSPELRVRSALHRAGFRFRLHDGALPGTPDLILPKHRAVVFVHGCFWHRHRCRYFKWPATRPDFWRAKIDRNRLLDRRASGKLRRDGWLVITIWECEVRAAKDDLSALARLFEQRLQGAART